jgi:hypothetical protein
MFREAITLEFHLQDRPVKTCFILPTLVALVFGGSAFAQSTEYMVEDCRNSSQIFFQNFQARSEAKYEGQRTDGTHAVNGTIYLENRSAYFSCSYNAKGDTLVEFLAEGKSWPDFVKGNGSPYMNKGHVDKAKDDSFETVCGVMAGGQDHSYHCKVTDHYQDGSKTSTTLRFPDQTLKMVWKSGKQVELHFEGMTARTVQYSNSEGEVDFVFEGKTYYYFSDKGRARTEVENLRH